MAEQRPFWSAYQDLRAGKVTRRQFMQRATALGVGLPVTMFVMQALDMKGVAAQTAAERPTVGGENMERGAGGELKLLLWQAPTMLAPHTATGTKDYYAASLVLEPLMSYMPDASLVPTLVKEVPSLENGLLSEDLTTVTYTLVEGVTWSDGEPFTAEDVAFTFQWIMHEANASTDFAVYSPVANVEALDELTARVTFKKSQPAWYIPFSGSYLGTIYPAHVWGGDPTNTEAINTFQQAPIGTGPYKIDSFSENDQVIYSINENYREPNKPFFATVNLKGGGEAAAAARAVLETGDWDYAWNLQVEPDLLEAMEAAGNGTLYVAPGTAIERININFADPNEEVEGQRAYWQNPHPFLSDLAVRQALALGVPRDVIASQLYQEGEPPTANILNGIPRYESPNTSWEFNVEQGKQLLEEAGWVMEGDVRAKDGVELNMTYSTSINQVRQKTQAIVKQAWEEMGVRVQLKQVDSGIFFDSSAGNDQNINHFYNDVQMYTSSASTPYPITFMANWYAGENGSNIAQASNDWSGQNFHRWVNDEYDQLWNQAQVELDPEVQAELFIQMNDLIINEVVLIPEVNRAADVYALTNSISNENVALSDFETSFWNIANWIRMSEA